MLLTVIICGGVNCGEGMELNCVSRNGLCPGIIGVCRYSDDGSFKLGEVGVAIMVSWLVVVWV